MDEEEYVLKSIKEIANELFDMLTEVNLAWMEGKLPDLAGRTKEALEELLERAEPIVKDK